MDLNYGVNPYSKQKAEIIRLKSLSILQGCANKQFLYNLKVKMGGQQNNTTKLKIAHFSITFSEELSDKS